MIRRPTLRLWLSLSLFLSFTNAIYFTEAAKALVADPSASAHDEKNLGITGGTAAQKKPVVKNSPNLSKRGPKKQPTTENSAHANQSGVAPAVKPVESDKGAASSTDQTSLPGASSSSSSAKIEPATKESVPTNSNSDSSTSANKKDTEQGKSAGNLTNAENSFGFITFSKLASNVEKNLFISPLSLHSCLHMIYNGAAGTTAGEMAKVLGFPPDSVNAENDQYISLMSELAPPEDAAGPTFVFSNANSLWANDNVKIKPAFADSSKKVFGAEVRNLDFSNPESSGVINSWVKDRTHGKIPKIIDQLRAEQVLVAVNAAYFKARWKETFDKSLTADGDFTGADGVKQVPMMNARSNYNYLENDDFQAIELPYEGGKTSLVVMLPRESSSLSKLRASLSGPSWTAWTDKMEIKKGELKLPRFTMHYESQCKDVLVDSGMKSAFGANSDFSGIVDSSSPARLSEVVHKTFVKVDEEGTEAAAATATAEKMLSMVVVKNDEPFKLIVNRPFFFAVVNWKTKAILFVGQCVNPSEG